MSFPVAAVLKFLCFLGFMELYLNHSKKGRLVVVLHYKRNSLYLLHSQAKLSAKLRKEREF